MTVIYCLVMSTNQSQAPPSLSKCKNYDDWKTMIKIWCTYTDLPKERQGTALFLSLEGEVQDAVSELSEGEISSETGVKNIIDHLDKLFKKDQTLQKYQAPEASETFRRPISSSIQEFLNEFEKGTIKPNLFEQQCQMTFLLIVC